MTPQTNPNVIAAIPTWNMGDQVINLLPPLQEQGFDGIFVLDDASQDDTPARINKMFGDTVQVIAGQENLGAAGNRNRLRNYMGRLGLTADSIITFIDADTQLIPNNEQMAETARALVRRHPNAGIIGGQVMNADGTWSAFNFGPPFSASYLHGSLIQLKLEQLAKHNTEAARQLRQQHSKILQDFPDIFSRPYPKEVGWAVETLTIIPANVYLAVGGYDASLQYCEAVDFGNRIRSAGLTCVFDPDITIKHLQVDVRGGDRQKQINKAIARLAWRHIISLGAGKIHPKRLY